uniref:Retrovirus-related Pol polyprotein from transposon TNT 1-94 n=1 Tax=Tanacetum cinerariifolium TaxID=118510 RepID=A0A699GTN9_TANCI|nr:retrovirus-related Pol polyprotein from transposon TNT 1-94 [Tanacetum cinerariifolium]
MKKLMDDMLPLEVTPKEGKSQAELTDASQVLLRVPRKNNMYSVNLKNIVPKEGLTCLFEKATSDESKLWHIRIGHLNFKTMNKLVKGNLIREAVNTACYVQNRVLVVKPHNKTTYELFHGRTSALSFMRPFGCLVTILNTKDHLGKFDGKVDEGFFVGYSLNSKAFRVFNNRTRIVEENFHSMKYKPVVIGNQSSNNACIEACDDIGKARMETVPGKDYILLPLWTVDPLIYQESKSSKDGRFQPSSNDGKNVDESPRQERMSELEDINIFTFSNEEEDNGAEADMNNLDTTIQASPTPTIRIHKDHTLDQVIRDLHSTPQTTNMSKNLEEHRFFGVPDGCQEFFSLWKIEKEPTESKGFKKIVDFLKARSTKYALTINPIIYTPCIEQFWATAKVKNINGEAQLHATVDGKKVVISEASIKRDPQFRDEGGVDYLPMRLSLNNLHL